jgi:hypothetical protein
MFLKRSGGQPQVSAHLTAQFSAKPTIQQIQEWVLDNLAADHSIEMLERMVAAEMPLILEIQTDELWQDVTLPMLETVRRRAFRAAHAFMRYARSAPTSQIFDLESTRAGADGTQARAGLSHSKRP